MVDKIDFYTSFGTAMAAIIVSASAIKTKGPSLLITDMAVWKPEPDVREFVVASLHPGVTEDRSRRLRWKVTFAQDLKTTSRLPISN